METGSGKRVKLTRFVASGMLLPMKTMTIGEFKAHFSEALEAVREGETIVVAYGRNREKVAAMIPYSQVREEKQRPLGLLEGKIRCRIKPDFALRDEDLLSA